MRLTTPVEIRISSYSLRWSAGLQLALLLYIDLYTIYILILALFRADMDRAEFHYPRIVPAAQEAQ
jgi:hypothetical protein